MNYKLEDCKDIKAEVVMVTPAMAAEMLTRNYNNRSISQSYVRMLVEEIKAGVWETTNQGIGFSKNGSLKDGQHRLAAIVQSNIAVPLLVVTGLPNDTNAIDGNRKRSVANRLEMGGISKELSTPRIVSAINALIIMSSNNSTSNATRAERFVKGKGEMLADAVAIAKVGGTKPVSDRGACYAAAFCALYNGISPKKLARFFEVVNSGFAGGDSESAGIVFRNYLLNNAPKNCGNKAGYEAIFTQCTRAIKDFCDNKPRRNLYSGDPCFFVPVKEYIEREIL